MRTNRMMALDCGEDAAKWTEQYLDLPGGRIVQADANLTTRPAFVALPLKEYNIRPQDYINFQDQVPVHLLSTESLDEVNKSLESSVDERNFRPNILVSGVTAPYDEDYWLKIFIGNTQMHGMWRNDRCRMTTVDPKTGTFRLDKEPIQSMTKSRTMVGHITPCLGVNLGTDMQGELRVGDEVFAVRGRIP